MNTFATFRLPDGSTIELVDWVDKPLFSTGEMLSGFSDASLELFTYEVGAEVSSTQNITSRRQSTENDTNMQAAGSMTSSEEMLVYSIKPEFFEFTITGTDATAAVASAPGQPMMRPSVLKQLHADLILRLRVTQKAYVEAGLGYFNTGFGVLAAGGHTSGALADANVRTYASQGNPTSEAVRAFAMPHHIGGTEKYQVELRNYAGDVITFRDEAGAAMDEALVRARIYMDGMRKRPTA